jgi:hypothetical protein
MLEGASIICFSQDWDGDPTSKKHIMRILATNNRVLWSTPSASGGPPPGDGISVASFSNCGGR